MIWVMRWTLALLTAVLLTSSACSVRMPRYYRVTRPGAEVKSLAVTEVTDEGARVEVTVELTNPNDLALPLRVARYTLRIESLGQTSLTDLPPVTIPAKGSRLMVLPASLPFEGGELSGQAYSFDGTVTFEPPGEVRRVMTESGIPLPSTPFRGEGTLQ